MSSWHLTGKPQHPRNGVSAWLLENLEGRVLLSRGPASPGLPGAPVDVENRTTSTPDDQTVAVQAGDTLTVERGGGNPISGGGQGGLNKATGPADPGPFDSGPPRVASSETANSNSGGPGGPVGNSPQNNGGGPGYPVPPLSGPAIQGVIGSQRQPIPVLLPLSEPYLRSLF